MISENTSSTYVSFGSVDSDVINPTTKKFVSEQNVGKWRSDYFNLILE